MERRCEVNPAAGPLVHSNLRTGGSVLIWPLNFRYTDVDIQCAWCLHPAFVAADINLAIRMDTYYVCSEHLLEFEVLTEPY